MAMLPALERVSVGRPFVRLARLPLVRDLVEPGFRGFARNRARFSWLRGSFRPAQRVGRAEPGSTHGRVEASDGADGQSGDDATHHGHRGDDRRPLL